MTEKYAKQLAIEKLNKEIINKIISEHTAEDFINFYTYHTRKETMDYFSIRTEKQLLKILKLFNYDFSKQKPSKFKGKPAARSHESYIAGGKKSSQTQKQNWTNKLETEKTEWSNKQKIAHSSDEFRQKIKQININYQASLTNEQKAEKARKKSIANKATWNKNKKEILEKTTATCIAKYGKPNYTQTDEYKAIIGTDKIIKQKALKNHNTKTQNNSWNTSNPEEKYYQELTKKYGIDDIIRQYRDDIRYPYNCDFYIKSKDLFIELNLTWSHGGHLYNPNNPEDVKKANIWKEKAKVSDYYKNALFVWTVKDPEKINTAKKNNLNYLVYYSEAELYE